MTAVKIMLNGLPGNVAKVIAAAALSDERFELLPYSLTGPEIDIGHCHIGSAAIELIRPEVREEKVPAIKAAHGSFLCIDFTHPSAVNANAEFYCRFEIPFVMGTTGGDRKRLTDAVVSSSICAVIAPNMAKQIVGFQAMMEYAANAFPDLFKGYSLEIKESHQKGKADTSGTAKAILGAITAEMDDETIVFSSFVRSPPVVPITNGNSD